MSRFWSEPKEDGAWQELTDAKGGMLFEVDLTN